MYVRVSLENPLLLRTLNPPSKNTVLFGGHAWRARPHTALGFGIHSGGPGGGGDVLLFSVFDDDFLQDCVREKGLRALKGGRWVRYCAFSRLGISFLVRKEHEVWGCTCVYIFLLR